MLRNANLKKMNHDIEINEILFQILNKLDHIRRHDRTWFTPEALAEYVGLSKHTIYQYVSNGKIPFYKIPGSCKLLFHKEEIDNWIRGNDTIEDNELKAEKVADEIWGKL